MAAGGVVSQSTCIQYNAYTNVYIYIRYYYGMRLVGERTRYSLATTQNLCITVHIPSIESADSCSS